MTPPLDVDVLRSAVRRVTAAQRIDIIANTDDGDMAAVVFPHEFTEMIAAEYSRLLGERVAPESESELRFAAGDR